MSDDPRRDAPDSADASDAAAAPDAHGPAAVPGEVPVAADPGPAPDGDPSPRAGDGAADASGEDAVSAPGPAAVTAGQPAAARPRRQSLVAASLIAVLTVLLGFAIAVQVRSTGTGEALDGAREEELVSILDDLDNREERLRAQIADQRGELRDLTDTDSRSAAALEAARSRADALAVLNGTVAAEGPGLVMTISDPESRVRVADLLDAIQELRGAGAETMQIDGVRVGVSTAVTGGPGDLRIDGRPVSAPYEVVVIGSPADLRTAMSIPGGVVDAIGRQNGSVGIEQRDRVVVDALRPLDEPQYAQPQPGD